MELITIDILEPIYTEPWLIIAGYGDEDILDTGGDVDYSVYLVDENDIELADENDNSIIE
ncbi:MAG: hypothetical protein J6T22_09240 [Bacteroidales bacterium]|nr:hypothetical protein [Bacteroidales bacterium]MBO7617377.1 hypothetical protein [Bacteroidales bacterium]